MNLATELCSKLRVVTHSFRTENASAGAAPQRFSIWKPRQSSNFVYGSQLFANGEMVEFAVHSRLAHLWKEKIVASLTRRNISAVSRTFFAAAATLFAFVLPAAGTTIIGPTDPSVLPGGAPFVSLGAPTAYGRAGGQTWSYGSIPYAGQTTVWHGAVRNQVEFTMSGPTFANPGEVMTFDAANSNLGGGLIVFSGSTLLPGTAGPPIYTRAILQYQNTSGVNVPVINPASVSVLTDGGILVVPTAGFRLNFQFLASFTNGASYSPALDFYDANHNPAYSGTAQVSFTAAFYSINTNPTFNTNTGATVPQGTNITITPAMLAATDIESNASQITYTLGPFAGFGGTVTQGKLKKLGATLADGGTFTQADINAGNINYTNNPISATSCATMDAFQFTLTDANGGTSLPPQFSSYTFPITITLTNLPPVASNASISVALGGTFNSTLSATNNDCFTPTYAFSVSTLPTKGSVTINANGTYSYTAMPGQTGADSFTFNVSDGVLNATAPGTVTVTITNQAPVAQDQTLTTNEGVALSGTLVANDADLPPSPLTYSIATNGMKGTALITNAATGAFTYTPAASRMGTDTFTFTASDGTLTSTPATVTVSIVPQVSTGRAVVSAGAATSGPTQGRNTKIFVVNPANGDFALLSSGGSLLDVHGVVVETSRNVLALDAAALIRVDGTTGAQTILAPALGAMFAVGVNLEANGDILLALGPGGGVSRRNPLTGAQINAFTGGSLTVPLGVVVAPNGDIYVANGGPFVGGPAEVLRINPVTGATSVVSTGGLLTFPVGIALGTTGTIYVTDAPGLTGGPGPSSVLSIDPVSGAQALISQDGLLSKPVSVAVEASGTLLVGNSGNGNLVRVNPAGGAMTLIAAPPEFNGLWGVTVTKAAPGVVVTGNGSSTVGNNVTFTATLNGGASPTGYIAFKAGGSNITGCAAQTVASNVATCTTNALPVGSASITAAYSGDTNNTSATSPAVTQVVNQNATITAVSSNVNPSVAGNAVTFTATVTGVSPIGTVNFKDGGTTLTGCGTVALAAGSATCISTFTTAGTKIITADYNGDTINAISTGTLNGGQVVNAPTITFSPLTLPNGTFNAAYAQGLAATGGIAPYSFAVSTGSLPTGLSLSTSGFFSGTPNAGGSFNFTVTATDANSFTGTRAYTIAINPGSQTVTFTPASPVSLGTGPITLTASSSSGLTSFTFSTSSGASICTVSSNQLSLVGDGTCALTATQAGDANYASANANANVIINPVFMAVQSRKTHGSAGTFDLTINTTLVAPNVTVEPRTIGSGHLIVFQFNGTVATPGTASVTPVGTATATSLGNEVLVTLNVPDNRRVTVTLTNVNGSVNPPPVSVGFLVGDVNNTQSVSQNDISSVKARSGQTTTAANFKFDVNASGAINASDISTVKTRSTLGLVLP